VVVSVESAVEAENAMTKARPSKKRFEIDFLTDYTDEALLGELRRIAALLSDGEPLTKTAYERHAPRVADSTIQRRFGGWREALVRAGLGHLYHGKRVSEKMRSQPARGMSNSDLIAELKRVHALVGTEWLTSDDFNALSITGEGAVRRRFGTFLAGLLAAGIRAHPNANPNMSDERCFENIAEVWTHHGRPPQYREMFQPPSRIQGKTYVTRWGTWRKTLKAFVDWANADDQSRESGKQELSTFQDDLPKSVSKKPPNKRLDFCFGMRYEKEWSNELLILLM
jgi:hypothetical protein